MFYPDIWSETSDGCGDGHARFSYWCNAKKQEAAMAGLIDRNLNTLSPATPQLRKQGGEYGRAYGADAASEVL